MESFPLLKQDYEVVSLHHQAKRIQSHIAYSVDRQESLLRWLEIVAIPLAITEVGL
jgi:hypothetical protein